MSLIFGVICALFVTYIAHRWYKIYELRQKLTWLPFVPGWPLIGNALEMKDSSTMLDDFKRLMPKNERSVVIRMGERTTIITTDYDLIEFVLSSQSMITKSAEYSFLKDWLGSGLLMSSGPKWKVRRRTITPAFHFSILEQFVDVFESNGEILMKKLKNAAGQDSVDIYPFMTHYALDIICETAMGVSVNAQNTENSEYVKNVSLLLNILPNRNTSVLKQFDFLFKWTEDYKRTMKAIQELYAANDKIIDERRSKVGDEVGETDSLGRKKKMAFLDVLLKSTENGEPLTKEAIKEEVATFMFAGHDTTSITLSFCLFVLAEHPEVQEKILEEQRVIFGEEMHRHCTLKDLNEMKYLECVIKESLRYHPTVPLVGRLITEDVYYKGNLIPKGTNINLFNYAVSSDPEYYPNPEKFDPSRFETMDKSRPYQYIPFSAGPRNCLGQKYAMLEMKSMLSNLMRNFEVRPATPKHELKLALQAVLKSTSGIRIKLVNREL